MLDAASRGSRLAAAVGLLANGPYPSNGTRYYTRTHDIVQLMGITLVTG